MEYHVGGAFHLLVRAGELNDKADKAGARAEVGARAEGLARAKRTQAKTLVEFAQKAAKIRVSKAGIAKGDEEQRKLESAFLDLTGRVCVENSQGREQKTKAKMKIRKLAQWRDTLEDQPTN